MATETTIKVTADTSQAQGAVKDLDRALSGLQSTGATVSKALLGVTAAAAGVGLAIKSVLDSAGELFDAADALGMSVQNLQVFQKAAGEVGVSAEALNMSLQKMNANIGDALIKGTGPAVDAFKRLGISLDTINGLKPDQQFELIAKQLNAIPNQAEKAALAMDGSAGVKWRGQEPNKHVFIRESRGSSPSATQNATHFRLIGSTCSPARWSSWPV